MKRQWDEAKLVAVAEAAERLAEKLPSSHTESYFAKKELAELREALGTARKSPTKETV